MTALNFVLHDEFLSLISDTLCTVGDQMRPCLYSSKVHAVPHLSGAFAMKGQGLFALDCLKALMTQIIARDVAEADPDVPGIYGDLWHRHLDLCSDQGTDMTGAKASVYHFGWVPSEGRIVGFEYKSEDGFTSTRVTNGCWLHPNTVSDITVRHPDDLIRITKKQKEIDDALPPEQRAGIGGDFHHLYLTKEVTSIQPVFRASDFDRVFEEMVEFSEEAAPTSMK